MSSSTFQCPSKKPGPPLRRPTKAGTATSLTDSKGTFPSPPLCRPTLLLPTASDYPAGAGKAAILPTIARTAAASADSWPAAFRGMLGYLPAVCECTLLAPYHYALPPTAYYGCVPMGHADGGVSRAL